MNWQPIETAPKDGIPVILLVDEGEESVAIQGKYSDDSWDVVWLDVHGCGCCGGGRPIPTHWMPLPEPPKQ